MRQIIFSFLVVSYYLLLFSKRPNETPFKFNTIHGKQHIEIYDSLAIVEPKHVILPWNPDLQSISEYQYQFKVSF